MFQWTRSSEMQAANRLRDAQDEYADALAVWQIQHNTNSCDFTPAQLERYSLFVRCVKAGVDCLTIVFWRWRVQTGMPR